MQEERLNYDESQMVVVGKFKGTYGLKGWIKLDSYLDRKHWKKIKRIFLRRKTGEFVPFEIESTRTHGKDLVLKLSGIDSMEDASKVASARVFLPKEDLPKKKRGEYYYFELEGLDVYLEDGTNLGKVTSIYDSHPYVFLLVDGDKLYIPFVKEIVLKVERDKIVVSNILKDLL